MQRPKIWGFLVSGLSLLLAFVYFQSSFSFLYEMSEAGNVASVDFLSIPASSYYAMAFPLSLVSLAVIGTGSWIGWTILTIKVVSPMPELAEKKDSSRIKAFFLLIITLGLMVLLGYGLYIKSFWALAVPAAVISFVILGAVFWVGFAIITTRTTLPESKKQ